MQRYWTEIEQLKAAGEARVAAATAEAVHREQRDAAMDLALADHCRTIPVGLLPEGLRVRHREQRLLLQDQDYTKVALSYSHDQRRYVVHIWDPSTQDYTTQPTMSLTTALDVFWGAVVRYVRVYLEG